MKLLFALALVMSTLQALGQGLDAGVRLYENKQYDLASEIFDGIKSTDPAYAESRYYLGLISFMQKEYDDAWDYFKAATKADDSQAKYYTWIGNSVGTMAQSAGKLKQARLAPKIKNAYKKAAELDPTDLDAQWGLVQFYTQAPGFMGGSWEKAEEAAKAIWAVKPAEGHDALATVYMSQDEPEKAEKEYLAACELEPQRLGSLGVFYQNQGWYDKAFDTFDKALKKFPDNMSLLYQVGRTSALSGTQPELGIESLEHYLKETDPEKAAPSHAGAKMRLAMIYEKLGDLTKAKSLYEASLKEDPEMELAKKGLKRVK